MNETKQKWVVDVAEGYRNFQTLIREQYTLGYVLHSWARVNREYSAVFVHDPRLEAQHEH